MTGLLPIMISIAANAAIVVPMATYEDMVAAGVELKVARPTARRAPGRRIAGRSAGRRSSRRGRLAIMYKCSECKKDFEFDPRKAAPDEHEMMGPGMGMGMGNVDCPECGAKKSGQMMIVCPNTDCGKHYVSARTDYDRKRMRGEVKRDEAPPKDICPHCKTDRMEWHRANRRRRGRRR